MRYFRHRSRDEHANGRPIAPTRAPWQVCAIAGAQVDTAVKRWVRAAAVAIAAACAGTQAAAATSPEFEAFLAGVRAEALGQGISAMTLDRALAGVEPIERILQRDRNQPEFQLSLSRYLDRVVTPDNVARGRTMAERHRPLLEEVARRFGVQPRFILAIWGIETRYGAIETSTPVIPAVATLAFDARRSTYFRQQLLAALKMVDRGLIELDRMTGSWAGAMGQVQFMPDSYLRFAVDFDGDGKRDIWSSTADVFASIANYLASNGGWNDAETWGRPVSVPSAVAPQIEALRNAEARGCRAMREMTVARPLPEWQAMGVRRRDGGALPARDIPAAIVRLDGDGGGSFAVYRNYRAILAYNCAHLYAITVGTLADRIGGG
jgi:membrane-bound lytic murein transglycosylase B